jgi:hypothetical protein
MVQKFGFLMTILKKRGVERGCKEEGNSEAPHTSHSGWVVGTAGTVTILERKV